MIELNEDTKFILGRPNFWCGPFAQGLRKKGHEIPNKAEEEQAYVIHWMLGMYETYGLIWKEEITKYLSEDAKKG